MYDVDAAVKTCRLVTEAYALARARNGEPDRDALDRAARTAILALGAEEVRRIDERVTVAAQSVGDPRGGPMIIRRKGGCRYE